MDVMLETVENMKFEDLKINEEILRALKEQGYEAPTPIQEGAIPAVLDGRDVLGLAQTGTGKTAAFAVPTLQILAQNPNQAKKRKIRALVLTPTRELGTQIYESYRDYGEHLPLTTTVIFGGVNQGKQVTALRAGVDVLVATPGRLIDLMNQGHVDISKIEIFILDEADRMLDMGFIHDIKRIMKIVPRKKQTLLFSATMPKEIEEIVSELLYNPVKVSVTPVSSTVDTVKQTVQFVDQKNKINLLSRFLKENPGSSVLVFTRTKRGADRVVKDLQRRQISALAIHGNKSQNARQRALSSFEDYEIQVLVATDIASRGIDINELGYVVNYDMPDVPETYVHRIGRTGRAGHEGHSISYVNYQEIELLEDIEKLIGKKIEVIDNPDFPLVDKTEKVNKSKANRHKKKQESIQTKSDRNDSKTKDNRHRKNRQKSEPWRKSEGKKSNNKKSGDKKPGNRTQKAKREANKKKRKG